MIWHMKRELSLWIVLCGYTYTLRNIFCLIISSVLVTQQRAIDSFWKGWSHQNVWYHNISFVNALHKIIIKIMEILKEKSLNFIDLFQVNCSHFAILSSRFKMSRMFVIHVQNGIHKILYFVLFFYHMQFSVFILILMAA